MIENYIEESLAKLNLKYDLKVKKLNKRLSWLYELITRIVAIQIDFLDYFNERIIRLYKLARYSTIPLNKIWVKSWLNSIQSGFTKTPFDEKGIHFFYARQGGGKSSIMFHHIKAKLFSNKKGAYLATQMEKPKHDEHGMYVYHRFISDLKDFFNDKEQKMAFDTEHFNMFLIDELFAAFNNRDNKSSEYNKVFIGLMSSLVQMRHQGIDQVLLSSQQLSSDVQLMGVVNYYHKVKAVKKFDYDNWLRTGEFKINLVGWKVKSFEVEHQKSDFKLSQPKSWYYPNIYGLEDFESLNMKVKYAKMKQDDFINNANYRYQKSGR